MDKKMTALIIVDGFGINPNHEGNAIYMAGTPELDKLMARYPHTQLGASGMDVGLPDGQMGNSEVGHLNMGAGRIVYQELTRITKDIQDGVFFEKEPLIWAMDSVKKNGGSLHLMACFPTAACTATSPTCTPCWKWRKSGALKRCSSIAIWTAATCRPPPPSTICASWSPR